MADHIFDEFKINDIDIDFVERMLKSLPSNIYFKDMEGKYVFCTHYWNHIKTPEDDPSWTIRGKYDIDIRKDKENALRAMEEDQRILATKKGTSYEIMEDIDGKRQHLQLIKNPVFDQNGQMIGIVGLINDITEQKSLEEKLEDMTTRDWMTGLRNRMYLDKWVRKHKQEDIYPFSAVMVDCNGLKHFNDRYGHLAGDRLIQNTAAVLKEELPSGAIVIRMGGDEFLSLLPRTSYEQAEDYIARVEAELKKINIFGEPISASMGAAACEDAGFRLEDLIRSADLEMYERKKESHRNRA